MMQESSGTARLSAWLVREHLLNHYRDFSLRMQRPPYSASSRKSPYCLKMASGVASANHVPTARGRSCG
jgi:hypothetical protein